MKKLIFVLLSLIVIFSCTKKQGEPVANEPAAVVVLNIGVMASMDYLPLAVAAREGYFAEQGVNVEIHKFFSANERDAAFQSGNIDGTVIDYTGAVLQKAGGVGLKLVSACDAPFYIIAGKDTSIQTLKDLQGKSIAISQNTVIDFIVDQALISVGVDVNAYEKVEINKIPLRFEMLRSGNIDATGLPDPLALLAKVSGDTVLASNDELGFAITGIMFREDALAAKSAAIKKMYAAYNKGVAYIQANPIEKIQDILISDMSFTEAIIPQAILPAYQEARPPLDADMQTVIEWLQGRGLVSADFDSSTLVDSSVL